jgi:hypothetical protein
MERDAPRDVAINSARVPLTCEKGIDLGAVLSSTQFMGWTRSVDPALHVKSVHVQSVDFFGPRIGFLKFKARAAAPPPPPRRCWRRGLRVARAGVWFLEGAPLHACVCCVWWFTTGRVRASLVCPLPPHAAAGPALHVAVAAVMMAPAVVVVVVVALACVLH